MPTELKVVIAMNLLTVMFIAAVSWYVGGKLAIEPYPNKSSAQLGKAASDSAHQEQARNNTAMPSGTAALIEDYRTSLGTTAPWNDLAEDMRAFNQNN